MNVSSGVMEYRQRQRNPGAAYAEKRTLLLHVAHGREEQSMRAHRGGEIPCCPDGLVLQLPDYCSAVASASVTGSVTLAPPAVVATTAEMRAAVEEAW